MNTEIADKGAGRQEPAAASEDTAPPRSDEANAFLSAFESALEKADGSGKRGDPGAGQPATGSASSPPRAIGPSGLSQRPTSVATRRAIAAYRQSA